VIDSVIMPKKHHVGEGARIVAVDEKLGNGFFLLCLISCSFGLTIPFTFIDDANMALFDLHNAVFTLFEKVRVLPVSALQTQVVAVNFRASCAGPIRIWRNPWALRLNQGLSKAVLQARMSYHAPPRTALVHAILCAHGSCNEITSRE
jgi:hypothetical protein